MIIEWDLCSNECIVFWGKILQTIPIHILYQYAVKVWMYTEHLLIFSLTERHEARWTDRCVRAWVPGEAGEAEVFPGEGRSGVCPAGGTLCTEIRELHLCCPLMLPGVDDGTCRKWLWFRWHFLPVLTSWCAGTVQRCQALSLFPLKMLFLPLFTGWLCV